MWVYVLITLFEKDRKIKPFVQVQTQSCVGAMNRVWKFFDAAHVLIDTYKQGLLPSCEEVMSFCIPLVFEVALLIFNFWLME